MGREASRARTRERAAKPRGSRAFSCDFSRFPQMESLLAGYLFMSSECFSFQVLNLHGNGLSRLQHLTCMTAMKKLTVSFNELTRLDDISYMVMSDDLT